jgi:hypothetical protein
VYSGIRDHALKAFYSVKAASANTKAKHEGSTVIARHFKGQKEQGVTDMDIASDCAYHLLAGIRYHSRLINVPHLGIVVTTESVYPRKALCGAVHDCR